MINKELEEFLDSDEDIENVKFDIEKVKENLPLFSNEKICEMIVCDRYLNFGPKISTICMEELAKRRLAGDTFNFEGHIKNLQSEMPVLDFTIPDIREILNQAISGKFQK